MNESTPTPLEALQAAVQAFVNEVDQGGLLTSWVVAYSTVQFPDNVPQDSLPLAERVSYSMGSSTSVVALSGLAHYLDRVAARTFDLLADNDDV